jgi:molecular chaperone GrpE
MTDGKKNIKDKKEEIEKQEVEEEKKESGQEESAEAETVSVPLKDYAAQLEEIDDLRQKVDDFSDGWQRERAEFANYRKRIDRDRDLHKQDSKITIIKKYLAVHDDLERAMRAIPQDSNEESWFEGLKLIDQKLKNILDGEGIQPIPAENTTFNPEIHEAISHEENPDFKSEEIIEVVQQGYTIGDRVIRPALVRVAK